MGSRVRIGHSLLTFLLATACTQLSPVETEAEKAFTPPEIYRTWYAEAELCSGVSGAFERILWVEAEVYDQDGVRRSGAWLPPHTIYLDPELVTATCDTVPDGAACFRQQNVKHEIIHDLRQAGHDGAYPDSSSVFIRCASRGASGTGS